MSLEAVVKLLFFVVIAPGTVVSFLEFGTDELVVAMYVDVANVLNKNRQLCLWMTWSSWPFFVVKATGNVVSSFGIRTDELVVAIGVVAAVCFEITCALRPQTVCT